MTDAVSVIWNCKKCGNGRAIAPYPGPPSTRCVVCDALAWETSYSPPAAPPVDRALEDRVAALEAAAREAGWASFGWLK